MILPKSKTFIIFVSACLITARFYGQGFNSDTNNIQDPLISIYKNSMGVESSLYTGTEYLGFVKRPKGHPFFQSDQFAFATFQYGPAVFRDSILYDLVTDKIVVRNYDRSYNLNLVSEKLGWFTLLGTTFLRLDADSTVAEGLAPGFFELLYNGKSQLLVKHRKQINSTTNQTEIFSEYVQYDSYFVRNKDRYYKITNRPSLLNAFRQKKSDIRKFLREKRLDLAKDPRNTILQAVAFFDKLTG